MGRIGTVSESTVSNTERVEFFSGVVRGLLQGRPLQLPMECGVAEELTKSWPTFDQLCVQNLARAISSCFFSYQERGQNPAGQKLTKGCTWVANFLHEHSVLKLQGSFLQKSSGNTKFFFLAEFQEESSASSSLGVVAKSSSPRFFFRRAHQVCRRTQ